MKETNAQLQTALADSEAARVLAEKRLAIATEALRNIRIGLGLRAGEEAATALYRIANLRLRKVGAQ